MVETGAKLLCIDLQVDPALGLQPDPRALFGARQLVAAARRKGWSIAHMRRRRSSADSARVTRPASALRTLDDLRPLPSEPVLLRSERSLACAASLGEFLQGWRGQTVYVAAFDRVALLSCLLASLGDGPRFMLVEDALAAGAARDGRATGAGFSAAVRDLAGGMTTLSAIFSQAASRSFLPGPQPFPDAAA